MTWTEEELKRLYDNQCNERKAQTEQLTRAREEQRKKEEAETKEREKAFRQMMEDIISIRALDVEVPAQSIPSSSLPPSPKQEKSFGGVFVAILVVVALAMGLELSNTSSDTAAPTRISETRSEPAQNGPDLEDRTEPATPPPERAHVGSPPAGITPSGRANNTHSDRQEPISAATSPPSLQVTHRVAPVYPSLARQSHVGGSVELSVEVLPDGRVGNVRVNKGSPQLARAAVVAVKKWRFQPYSAQPGEGPLLTPLIVNFRLK